MKIEEFNRKYARKGGIAKLSSFRNEFKTIYFIADHFGVSAERVRQWMKEMFDKPYDSIKGRRENEIRVMIEFSKLHGLYEMEKYFRYSNKSYLNEAIKRYNKNGTK